MYFIAVTMFSGWGNKHPNVVEAISKNKLLVKDIKDDKQRIIEIDQKKLKYYRDNINSIKFQKEQGR